MKTPAHASLAPPRRARAAASRTRAPRHKPGRPPTGAVALPSEFQPQLATLVRTLPDSNRWLHELKYDGFRIGCRIDRGQVQLLSRGGKDWTARFPSVRFAAARLPVRAALLDGEVAVLLPDGSTSFQALQNVVDPARAGRLVYFVFDLLHLDGVDIRALPLEQRKAELRRLLSRIPADSDVLRYADHIVGNGPAVLARACESGAEGIVAKRRDLPYQPGRGSGWLKAKCLQRQEFVIGGFTDPEGSRVGIGALLLGVYGADGRLRYAGKVGTGFSQESATALRQNLEAIEQRDSPFDPRPTGVLARRAHWVNPALVAEVNFTEWTAAEKIRHPSFQGLRADKDPRQVIRERPVELVRTGRQRAR
ncbi:MAG: non-homologous end-joining DNA ligase [Candidatus Binatia bacterium]